VKVLRDGNGNYLKTVCLVILAQTYDRAVQTCSNNGMTLLNINSPQLEMAVQAHSDSLYLSGYLWYQGKAGTMCSVLRRLDYLRSFTPITALCNNLFYYYCEMRMFELNENYDFDSILSPIQHKLWKHDCTLTLTRIDANLFTTVFISFSGYIIFAPFKI
jgi:hypothetical protein